ncbi:MAG: hypothetical protein ACYCU7_18570, partial [Acidimicrobiales bacterium]
MVERSGIVGKIDAYIDEDIGDRRIMGRPRHLSIEGLLVALLAVVHDRRAPLLTNVRDVLFFRLPQRYQDRFGVVLHPHEPTDSQAARRAANAYYKQIEDLFHFVIDRFDFSGRPKNRIMSEADLAAASIEIDPQEAEVRRQRLAGLIDALLESTYKDLPREVRRRWKGSVAIDATPVPAFARGPRNGWSSSDPDAAWYVRETEDHAPSADQKGHRPSSSVWSYEASFVVTAPSEPIKVGEPRPTPGIVLAMELHIPGFQPGKVATRLVGSVRARNHPADYLGADRAYSNSKPEDFQLPVRAMGYRPVFDYRVDQLGLQGSHNGA